MSNTQIPDELKEVVICWTLRGGAVLKTLVDQALDTETQRP